ncbi:ring-infected erythrocyte surface antigen 2 [Plasmodium reichenowi]|uniref:Ring-infected erythrocyte surface antigen 2 n=1 Tax=Plasmodium reichenowi TaxID=5854 RepID=A0A060RVA2_PLARE|nr:ring-infected erythrocyte surface antigen 2 [Plasmodium reichenowi]
MKQYSSYRMYFLKKYLDVRYIKAKNRTPYFFEEEKQNKNKNKNFLKILCSKRFLVPILGMLYIILNYNFTYNTNSTCSLQLTDRCSRNLYGKELSTKEYMNSRYPIVISRVFDLPSEKPTFTLECPPDIDYTNILGFNEKLMNDANRYTLLNNYEIIPHVEEFKPLFVDNELFEYNQKVDNIGRNGEDILTAMQTLWNEIMNINKKNYNLLKVKLHETFHEYMIQCNMPKKAYVNKWRQCLKLINQGGHNLEKRLNKQFYTWYNQNKLYLEEYRRLTVLNQIVWKALSNQIEYSCRKIMTSDISSFKRINELKRLEEKEEKDAEEEMKKREQLKEKKKSRRSIWFSCGGDKQKNDTQEHSSKNVREHQINEYGDILPSLRASINNSAINYYDTVKYADYLDHESSDALYTEEDYWFDLEKQTYTDIINMRKEENAQSQRDEEKKKKKKDKTQEIITTKQENIEVPSEDVQKKLELDKITFLRDKRFYDILGVDINADMNKINESYYKLANKHYPEYGSTLDDLKKFKEINEAYQILGDIDNKRIYNQYGYNGIKNFNFIHPSLFHFFSCLKNYDYYTGTPHITIILKFLFEKKLTMDDIETKSQYIMGVMNEYQKEIEDILSLRLIDKIQGNIDGIKNWDTLIISEIKKLLKSHFSLPILDSMAHIFTNVSECYNGNQEKAKKKIEKRFKKNKLKSSCAYNELRYTLREYFKTRKQVSSLSYTLQNKNNNIKYKQNKWYKHITDLDDRNKNKILCSFVKNILKIALSDIEYTIRTVCERILKEEGIDEITIKKRAESLNKLGYIIRQNILRYHDIKKIIKHDTQNIAANIVTEINTINELLK